jgi:hypothetical protein
MALGRPYNVDVWSPILRPASHEHRCMTCQGVQECTESYCAGLYWGECAGKHVNGRKR